MKKEYSCGSIPVPAEDAVLAQRILEILPKTIQRVRRVYIQPGCGAEGEHSSHECSYYGMELYFLDKDNHYISFPLESEDLRRFIENKRTLGDCLKRVRYGLYRASPEWRNPREVAEERIAALKRG